MKGQEHSWHIYSQVSSVSRVGRQSMWSLWKDLLFCSLVVKCDLIVIEVISTDKHNVLKLIRPKRLQSSVLYWTHPLMVHSAVSEPLCLITDQNVQEEFWTALPTELLLWSTHNVSVVWSTRSDLLWCWGSLCWASAGQQAPVRYRVHFFLSMMSSCPNYEAAKPRNHDGPSTLFHLGDDVFMVVCRAPFYTELHILPKQSAHETFSQRCCGLSNCSLANCRSWSDGLMNKVVTQLQWFFQAFSCDSEVVYYLTNHSVPLDAHVLGK